MQPERLSRPYSRRNLEHAGARLIAYGTGIYAFAAALVVLQVCVVVSFAFGSDRWAALEWLGLGVFLALSIFAIRQRYTGIWVHQGRLVLSRPFSVFTYTDITTTLDRMWDYPAERYPFSAIRLSVGGRKVLRLFDAIVIEESQLPFQYQKSNL